MSESIYLDHNATAPIRPEAVEAMVRCYAQCRANPASVHRPGRLARKALEDAREQIAEILGVELGPPRGDRLIFTSGGAEANNLAVLGIAASSFSVGEGQVAMIHQIILSAAEHQSVIEPAERLLEQGWRLDTLGLTADGVVRADQLPTLLSKNTRLVCVQLGNHETGVLQPVEELAALCDRAGVPLHTDAVQVVGKLPVSFRRLGAAAMSFAAHKFQGPAGIGALALRGDVSIRPLIFGGRQQGGIRPGTEPVALAVGMAAALELWRREQDQLAQTMRRLRDRFEIALREAVPNIVVHGAGVERLPQTSNIAFPGHDAEMLLTALDQAGVACSVGSACSSGATELSPTLRAMGMTSDITASSLRFSLGATTTAAEIEEAVRRIAGVCRAQP